MRFALLIILFFTLSANATEKIYRVAVDAPYPLFAYEVDGKLTGFDVEIAYAVCNQIKIKCVVVTVPFDQIIPSIQKGAIDFAVAGMANTKERSKLVLFSDRYFRSSAIFAGLMSSEITADKINAEGTKIGLQSGTIQEDYAKSNIKSATIVTYKHFDEIFEALKNGKIDLAFVDGLSGYYRLKQIEGIEFDIIGTPVRIGTGSCMTLNIKSTDLKKKIDEAIKAIRLNGVYDEINRRYFEFNVY